MTRVSQALRVGDLERADMDSGGTDDGVELPVSEASSDGCKCCKAVLRVCCVRFSRVRGSAHSWASRSVLTADSDRLRGGAAGARRLVGRKTSESGVAVTLVSRSNAAFSVRALWHVGSLVLRRCVVML